MLTFQDLTQKLIQFWAKKGCIIHQGHDVEVGAGTFNPATFLRCLGPEPYKTVYVEPSRRPQDGRYGENPNRLQLFHQLQVIMKPSPPDIKQYYLESLQEIGFNLNEHDIRFVHDDWESPTLGASGLGWEVWIDGMEVTQFTYFQSVAGFDLHPISVEITYGLERICMLSQRVSNFFVMKYNDELTYGDVYHRNEVEWSHYNFKESTPEMWFKHFEDFEKEAKNLISLNLPIPAYDFVMKASHAFNMLEARGVISVTERTGYIQRIRELAKLSATEYLLSREKLNFPLLKDQSLPPQPHPASFPHTSFHKDKKRDFLFEIGTEQLPATFVPIGMRELEEKIRTFLTLHKIPFSALRTYGSPQRIAIQIDDLAEGTPPSKVEKRGPQTSVAFDHSGNLTAQGKGFFDAHQIPYANLETLSSEKGSMQIRTLSGKEYLFAEISEEGKSTLALLQPFLSDIFSQLSFPKVMRWGNFSLSFARPIRWITALFGSEVVPITVTGIKSSNITWGHAQRHHEPILLSSPKDYEKELEKAFVIADAHKRKEKIISQLRAIEEKTNCKALSFERVLNEVTFLVEWPELAVYDFDPKFLKAPAEVLVSEMVEHQRYFPLEEKKTGKLAPHFVITADQKINPEILQNNLAVLSARLTDGVFLYSQDLKIPLEIFVEKLKTVTFHKELGSVYDKLSRIEANALLLNEMLHVSTIEDLKRASHLCKADLASDMVHEFPELQGIIGMYYAKHQGESELIATAMKEHWQPISEKGALPQTDLGRILSLADKLDNILSYYSVGIKPTSSKDPYALRRQTLGILKILVDAKWSLSLDQIFSKKLKNRPLEQEVIAFFSARLKTLLEEMGFEKDEIEACLSEQVGFNPLEIVAKVKALHHFRKGSKDFGSLVEVFRRAKGQIGGRDRHSLEINLFTTDQEKDLYDCLTRLDPKIQKHLSLHEYEPLFSLLTELQKPMAHLFDQVKILDPDEKIKANRIALLQEVFERFQGVIDMDKLQIKA